VETFSAVLIGVSPVIKGFELLPPVNRKSCATVDFINEYSALGNFRQIVEGQDNDFVRLCRQSRRDNVRPTRCPPFRSPDGMKWNPGIVPDFASLHPGCIGAAVSTRHPAALSTLSPMGR
jgi:hypothetical protein